MAKVVPIDGDSPRSAGAAGKIRLPGPSDRTTIIGPTGSGKTHAAIWHLSHANFTSKPWVVIDPKREELISQIDGAQYIDYGEIPKYPGIYVVNPIPSDAPLVDAMLTNIWDKEDIGVWIDEGLMFGTGDGIDALFTQGRSKHIPMIMLMQRAAWVSRFAVSEATFIHYFGMSDKRDRAVVQSFAENLPVEVNLEKFHSMYYDVPRRRNCHFSPLPESKTILNRINSRLDTLRPQRKVI